MRGPEAFREAAEVEIKQRGKKQKARAEKPRRA